MERFGQRCSWDGGAYLTTLDIGAGRLPKGDINLDVKLYPEWKLLNKEWVLADAKHLPFRKNAFEKVLAKVSLPYVGDEPTALREIQRVLRDDGIFELSHHSFMFYVYWLIQYSKERLLQKRLTYPAWRTYDLLIKILVFLRGNRCLGTYTSMFQTGRGLRKQLSRFGFETISMGSRKIYPFPATHVIDVLAKKQVTDEGEVQYRQITRALGNLRSPFLDLGCGEAHVASAVEKHGIASVATDLRMPKNRSIPFCRCVAEHLPFRSEVFGSVALISVLEHVKNVEQTILEVARVLKGGGQVYVYAPNFLGPPYEHHFKFPFVPLPKRMAVGWFAATKRWWSRRLSISPSFILGINYTTLASLRKLFHRCGIQVANYSYERAKNRKNPFLKARLYLGLGTNAIYLVGTKVIGEKFWNRRYPTYQQYLAHQGAKLSKINLSEYDVKFREVLRERVRRLVRPGTSVLCLGARIGTEVKAFIDLGCFTVGIDINPGPSNRFVVYGDFHDVQFASESVDVVYTNSLDHVFDLRRVIDEAKRVLKPDGLLILETVKGTEEGERIGEYESLSWATIDDLLTLLQSWRLTIVDRTTFNYPWNGEQFCLKKLHAKKSQIFECQLPQVHP